jgi:hypothetical protein
MVDKDGPAIRKGLDGTANICFHSNESLPIA